MAELTRLGVTLGGEPLTFSGLADEVRFDAAQTLLLLERNDEARPFIERLRRFGYRPIDPAAASALGLASFPLTSTETQQVPPP